jgi:hypothetical protein
MIRWGWRLLHREWRQQLLVLGMLAVAVAATIFGAGVATNTRPRTRTRRSSAPRSPGSRYPLLSITRARSDLEPLPVRREQPEWNVEPRYHKAGR